MDTDIPPNIFWSNVAGYVSICCWLVVFTPQIWENYTRKSGEGLSMLFLWIWLLGDFFNVAGVLMQDLLFTMLLLAIYYTLADTILVLQVYYYRRYPANSTPESTPLLPNRPRRAIHKSYLAWGIGVVLAIQVLAYLYLWGVPAHPPSGSIPDADMPSVKFLTHEADIPNEFMWLPAVMGWASAALYCGSRVPQIVKNFRKRSTEGLSLMMFAFSVLGNTTYCLSIFLKSTDLQYLLINLPWLAGSGGTLLFDFIIFGQFFTYRNNNSPDCETGISRSVSASHNRKDIDV